MSAANMSNRHIAIGIVLAIVLLGFAFRLPHLAQRPMHTDEAVQAVKTGELAATGHYIYDPNDFHGPTLPYLSLPSIWLHAGGDSVRATAVTYRIVPFIFGLGLILLMIAVEDGLGWRAVMVAAGFTAISPAMTYYSRYYIHETLLVFFSFLCIAAGWRYVVTKKTRWAVACGVSLGLMHATKETCILAFASFAAALVLTVRIERHDGGGKAKLSELLKSKPILLAAGAGLAVSITLFSSFFTNLRGPVDSLLTYATYLARAGGNEHTHPPHYYFKLLLYNRQGSAPIWSEALIVILAIAGGIAAFSKRAEADDDPRLVRFLAFYTLILAIVYSAIPYKTPWNMLSFFHGMILLAGVGTVSCIKWMPNMPTKVAAGILIAAASIQLTFQTCRTNDRFQIDRRNPYVYAHAGRDVVRLATRIEGISGNHPDGFKMFIRFVTTDPWPMPWYLRAFEQVGYWSEVPDEIDAPIIVFSPEHQEVIDQRKKNDYQQEIYGLRPTVHLMVYIRKDLWNEFIKSITPRERRPTNE